MVTVENENEMDVGLALHELEQTRHEVEISLLCNRSQVLHNLELAYEFSLSLSFSLLHQLSLAIWEPLVLQ